MAVARNSNPGFKAEFIVHAPTKSDSYVFVAGNCEELGNWNPDEAVPLNKMLDGEIIIPYQIPRMGFIWSGSVEIKSLSSASELRFYYFIGTKSIETHTVSVQRVEGHHSPRIYRPLTGDPETDQPDLFAVIDEEEASVTGYLSDRSTIIFTFDPANIEWNSQKYYERQFRVRFEHAEPVRYNLQRRPEFKVARYFRERNEHEFLQQSKHGPLIDSQPLMYRCIMNTREACHVRVDFYEVKKSEVTGVPPTYFAYALIGGTLLTSSHGWLTVPIRIPARKQVLRVTDCGQLKLQYTVVKSCPLLEKAGGRKSIFRSPALDFHCQTSPLHIGHRGCGSSYHGPNAKNPEICENTIASFSRAAAAGADFVEFDVMFDVDLKPIVYHDHTVLARSPGGTLTELAVKDLTEDLLISDAVHHITEKDGRHLFPKTGANRPFPALSAVFSEVDPGVGFNVEVKYPAQMLNGQSELNPTAGSSFREEYRELRISFWNKNVYVDGILHVVFQCAGDRPVIFSSFDLDVCIMLRLKQIEYPVYLLLSNDLQKGLEYEDVRINYLKRAVYSAASFELDGVVVPSEVVFQHSWFVPLVRKFRLTVIVYGEANNSVKAIEDIKATGIVKGIIYDRIYEFIEQTKENHRFRIKGPCLPANQINCRDYVLGYTGYVPGRLSKIGAESVLSGNAKNSQNLQCRNVCK
ncbi:glycerophosphocholine phosphodiesterase GPCPD1-like [Paramacrobiotus metropolitanus]|uniref:glycerophosphocholine phosphodiesterase GPCPD1-like n=1 Tax=Paramacrobiotus metropolitanus TaxID=2943436 RepID=UPI0024465387|nr:glycerophosphocholine phosphodiesterase GPCPD1-like [Paramacrobiotus metropolitanus]